MTARSAKTSVSGMERYKTVDEDIAGRKLWREKIVRLREILVATELTGEVMWGGPC